MLCDEFIKCEFVSSVKMNVVNGRAEGWKGSGRALEKSGFVGLPPRDVNIEENDCRNVWNVPKPLLKIPRQRNGREYIHVVPHDIYIFIENENYSTKKKE
eukprot:c9501_g1_i2.p3 GENE.c9501_g1_i2~~c9501_g1_i2.p3  ORF type:complete len:100 (+),score=15.77 c9501_g1_i2:103-402(+)